MSRKSAFEEGSTLDWEEIGFYLLFNQGRNTGTTSNKFAIKKKITLLHLRSILKCLGVICRFRGTELYVLHTELKKEINSFLLVMPSSRKVFFIKLDLCN